MKVKKIAIKLISILWAAKVVQAADFYVAPGGNDSDSGTKNQPMATIEAARDAARKAGSGSHRIVLLPGDYFLATTFTLDARDNGLTLEASEAGKATLYGGRLVSGWRRDGDKFWCADLPSVTDEVWDLRALVVNGRMADPARMPESGAFEDKNEFDVKWLTSVGGGWARPPTEEELTTLRYDPKDIPATLNVSNAELRIYHMWDESRVGVISNETKYQRLVIRKPLHPPGAFGIKKYVVFNTREGMTRPGQWYLDRTDDRVVYWPLPGEDMTQVKVVAPVLERIISIVGTSAAPMEKITLRGLVLQATTTPLKPGGFAAGAFEGALHLEHARRCVLENLEIANVAGQGVQALDLSDCQICDCRIHDTGACAIEATGDTTLIASNQLYCVGMIYPSAVALKVEHDLQSSAAKGFHIFRNEVHDTSYSGIICSGAGNLIEENLIYHVMREMSDGGAIYGNILTQSVLRGNYVRDVVKAVEGYGVSAFYLDEGSEDCLVERNVSVGVERPIHNHIARNITIHDNVFIAETNMTLSFERSIGCTFEGNTLFVPGEITIKRPPGIKLWTNNIIFRNGMRESGSPQPFTIDNAMPIMPPPERRTSPIDVGRVLQPPTIDGEIRQKEWPGGFVGVDRESSRWDAGGAPVFASFSYDNDYLYVAVKVALFDLTDLRKGSVWGQDDGAELDLAGDKGTFVLHGFANGTLQSVTNAGVSAEAAIQFGRAVRFATTSYGKTRGDWKSGWSCEWAIPFDALGAKPTTGLKIASNIATYRAEDGICRCLEGTLAENWRVEKAATLQFK